MNKLPKPKLPLPKITEPKISQGPKTRMSIAVKSFKKAGK